MRTQRTIFLSIALALGLIAAACGGGDSNSVAADVDETELSYDEVFQEMADRGDVYNEDPETYSIFEPFSSFSEGDVDTVSEEEMPLVQEVLGRQIIFEMLNAEVEARGETVTEEDAANARQAVEASYGELLDTPFHNREVERFEDVMILTRVLGEEIDEITVEELYEQVLSSGDTACSSHILVETLDEANQVIADLEAGGSFEDIAREQSLDPGSGASGGSLGCGSASQFVPEFGEAVLTQPVGEVGEPVQTDFGFHVIRVDARPMPLDDESRAQLQLQVDQTNEQSGRTALDTFIRDTLETSEVVVDPAIGFWDPAIGAVVSEDPEDPEVPDTAPPAEE